MNTRRSSRLPVSAQKRLLEHFAAGTPARSAADLIGVNRSTATLLYRKLRETIEVQIVEEAPLEGEVEVDESYFGGERNGKRGRGAAGKVVDFGLLKLRGRVHVVMIPDVRSRTLMPILRQKNRPDSVVYTDALKSYNVLDISEFRHRRIDHGKGFVLDVTTSTASRISGTRRSGNCGGTTEYRASTSICSWPSANGASTMDHLQGCCRSSLTGLNFQPADPRSRLTNASPFLKAT
jgi:transposase